MAISEMAAAEKERYLSLEKEYDKVPYTSYPFEHCRPENLRSIGMLFGMSPPKIETARVLELGCSDGGNILRFPTLYPESYTLGIDLSSVEIKHGQDKIRGLKLNNMELKQMSITDLDESYGKFDYIICHGVYSWVSDFVRAKILEVSKKLLNENGIAFISYNTLPGWNMYNTIRELMLYHAKGFSTEQEKVLQGKLVLDFLKESLSGNQTPHAQFMSAVTDYMYSKEDYYVRHEYLGEENKAFYFHEFMAEAEKHGLDYIADSDLRLMYSGNLPAATAEKLGAIGDIIKTEQYIDFIRNTQFRNTLLCHKNTPLSRNITYDRIKKFYLSYNIVPEEAETQETYTSTSVSKFYVNNDKNLFISTSSPGLKAILYSFFENIGNPLPADELMEMAAKKASNIAKEHIEAEFAQNTGKLIFSSNMKIFADRPIYTYKISNKPRLGDYALYQLTLPQLEKYCWFTNQTNERICMEMHNIYILRLLDGKHTLEEIRNGIFKELKDGAINVAMGDEKIEDEHELRRIAEGLVNQALQVLRTHYSLIS